MTNACGDLYPLHTKIAFRVDASQRIGIGHVMRCLALANALSRFGVQSIFVCRQSNVQLQQMLERSGHSVCQLDQRASTHSENSGEYAGWLGVAQKQDAQDTLEALAGQAIAGLVVDHYALDAEWESYISGSLDAPILAIDDLCRSHSAQIIVDTTYARSEDAYLAPPGTKILTGTTYALLRPEFAEHRIAAEKKRKQKAPVSCVLLAMGGGDPDNLSARLISALLPTLQERGIRLVVLTGAAYARSQQMQNASANSKGALIYYHNITDVAPLLIDADICVGAAGSSSWERCCLGLPTISIVLAENQKDVSQQLTKAGAIVNGGTFLAGTRQTFMNQLEDNKWLEQYLMPLIADEPARRCMSETMMSLVDGYGAMRVAGHLVESIFEDADFWLRPAKPDDSEAVYHWRYDGDVARFYGDRTVPEFSAHDNWFQCALNDPNRNLLIAQSGQENVAHLRFDQSEDGVEISICVNPDLRGHGIGRGALSAAIRYVKQRNLGTITARVHVQNLASVRLFASVGFTIVSQDENFLVMQAFQIK